MLKLRVLIFAGMVVLGFSPILLSTTILYMDTVALFDNSTEIAVGAVKKVESKWDDQGGMIYTYVTLEVDKNIKGFASGETQIVVPGGVVGDRGIKVNGVAKFREGEKVLVYLRDSAKPGIAANINSPKLVTGYSQGKFNIFIDKDTGQEMIRRNIDDLHLMEVVNGKFMKKEDSTASRTQPLSEVLNRIQELNTID